MQHNASHPSPSKRRRIDFIPGSLENLCSKHQVHKEHSLKAVLICHDYLVKQNVFIKGTVGMDFIPRQQSEHRLPLCTKKQSVPKKKT